MALYKRVDIRIVLRAVHPLFEPCVSQILAFRYSSIAGCADNINLVIPREETELYSKQTHSFFNSLIHAFTVLAFAFR